MSWGLQKCQGQQKGAFKIVFRERKPPNRDGQFYVNRWQGTKPIAQLFYLSKRMIIRLKKTEQILIWENWKKQRWGNCKTLLSIPNGLRARGQRMKSHDWKSYQRKRVRGSGYLEILKWKMGVRQETAGVKCDPNFQKRLQPQPGSAECWVGKGDFISQTPTVLFPVPHDLPESCHSLSGTLSIESLEPGQNSMIDGLKKENVAELTPHDFQITLSSAVRKPK